MDTLDEKGFVFVSNGIAYQVRMWGDCPWLCYWHEYQKCFVTQRALNQTEVWQLSSMKLPEEQANIYFDKLEE